MGLGALGLVLVFVGIIGLAAVIGCSSSAPAATSAQASDAKIYLHVTAGRTSKEIGQELEQHGVIANHWKFWLVAKMNGYDNQIKTGIYELHPNMEPRDVLQMLVNGETTPSSTSRSFCERRKRTARMTTSRRRMGRFSTVKDSYSPTRMSCARTMTSIRSSRKCHRISISA